MTEQEPSLLQEWASLGNDLLASRAKPVANWEAAKKMIDAVRPKMEADAKLLRCLLVKSREKLKPLGEPLDLDLGLHRWLDAEREEAYSDWLEWVIRQARTPARVFRLFGLELPPDLDESTPLEVQREFCIPHGHTDQEGRLDLVIQYGTKAMIVVEVKKGDAEGADTEKHGGYVLWMNQQPHGMTKGVLLVVSAEEQEYGGFPFRLWADVCIAMRRLAIDLCNEKGMMSAAMVLAFVAAVEQNLLGFPADLVRKIDAGHAVFLSSKVVDHIERFVNEHGEPHGTHENQP